MSKFAGMWAESATGNVSVTLSRNSEAIFNLISLQALGRDRPKIKASVVESDLKSLIQAGSRQALERNGPILLQLATGRPGRPPQRVLFPPRKTSSRRDPNLKRPESNVITFPKRRQARPEETQKTSPTIETPLVIAKLEGRIEVLEERLESLGRMVETMRRNWREANGLPPESSNLPTV